MRTRTSARTIATLAAIALLSTGCGGQPDSGTIVDKRSEPGHWETTKTCARKVGGKCRTWKTAREWDGADYELLIRSGGSEEWVEVDADTYEHARVGGMWPQ